ncbi:hypothetical protein NEAUS03_2466, partial [Nematocida ausubeli]
WLVSGVLVPRAQYGVAIYAHNYAMLAGLAKLYNRALALVAGKRNVCTRRILDELNLPLLQELAFFFKIKSLAKWRGSEAGAGELINSRQHFKLEESGARRTTWCNRVAKTLKRTKIGLDDSKEVMKAKLAEYFRGIRKFCPKSKALDRARDLGLLSGTSLRRVCMIGESNAGLRLLLRCRLGTMLTYNDLVRMNRIQGGELGRCLGCGQIVEESPEHVLLDCERHSSARSTLDKGVLQEIRLRCPNRWRRLAMSWLMGGAVHWAVSDIVARESNTKEQLWRTIALERNHALGTCISDQQKWREEVNL